MSELDQLAYNEVEFLIPAYRFNIRFSYVTQKALPFIREFVLRLVHLGELEPNSISEYFGLSAREVKEALGDLIDRGDLKYTEQGRLKLTEQAKKYFAEFGGALKVTDLASTGVVLGFESTAFNCVSAHNERLDSNWNFGLQVDVPSENIAKREKLASQAFQKQFSQLVEDKLLGNIDGSGVSDRLRIYKLDSIRQVAQGPFRIKLCFKMDEFGRAIERDELEQLKLPSVADELITKVIHKNLGVNNLHEVLGASERLGDGNTKNFFTERGIDAPSLKAFHNQSTGKDSDYIPFIGPLYAERNWRLFESQFKHVKDKILKTHQEKVSQLSWLFPSSTFWGKSSQLPSRLEQLINEKETKGKKGKLLYKPTFYAPVSEPEAFVDKRLWKNELTSYIENTNYYLDGFLDGAVEVLCLDKQIAAVVYHLSLPEVYPVTVPVGFITRDLKLVSRITSELNEYLQEIVDGEHRRDLGFAK